MLEQLGGHQFRHFSLSAKKRKASSAVAALPEDEQDAGWDFIIANGERGRSNLKQLLWIHRHIKRDGSPINGWNEKLVQRGLDSLANDGALAALISRYDLTIAALHPDLLSMLERILPHLRLHSLWLLGQSGVGKTPLARIIAMMFSRHYGGTGTFRTASEFDFFRGLFFEKTCPAVFDDGTIGNETIKKKKAFSDVGDQETITKERWNAAKFVRHQLRIVCDNQYDPEREPTNADIDNKIEHEAFLRMVRPAIGDVSDADSMAVLKRAAFLLFTKENIYFRFPTERKVKVERLHWPRGDILTDACKKDIANMKAGGPPPEDFEASVAWECAWLAEAPRKHDHPVQPAAAEGREPTPLVDALLLADHGATASGSASSVQQLCPPPVGNFGIADSSLSSVVLPPGRIKMEAEEFHEGHAWLARECAKDAVNCDNDPVIVDWSRPVLVKREPEIFTHLRDAPNQLIELDTPSPSPKKRATQTAVLNPLSWPPSK